MENKLLVLFFFLFLYEMSHFIYLLKYIYQCYVFNTMYYNIVHGNPF